MLSDEDDGRAVHDLHPVPGYVLPNVDDEDEDDMPAARRARPKATPITEAEAALTRDEARIVEVGEGFKGSED
jgi:hypothetical protein